MTRRSTLKMIDLPEAEVENFVFLVKGRHGVWAAYCF